MTHDSISNNYFDWLYNLVCGQKFSDKISYKKLLMRLHNTTFRYSIPKDENRADDGLNLRFRFMDDADLYLTEPCSVLEMMVALTIRCEESIMDDPKIGDRTRQWFWGMIRSLELNEMTDSKFDRKYVDYVLDRFMEREYAPDGRGGLFTIRNCDRDLRDVEIWYQLCWYLDSIV